jgi:hypothetical protein
MMSPIIAPTRTNSVVNRTMFWLSSFAVSTSG